MDQANQRMQGTDLISANGAGATAAPVVRHLKMPPLILVPAQSALARETEVGERREGTAKA
ncbi:MAG TPA: hypothetical protein VEB21_04825 [Terriglobales bacterium]|nr:hypothetical protein [Terriglobales bacterium]